MFQRKRTRLIPTAHIAAGHEPALMRAQSLLRAIKSAQTHFDLIDASEALEQARIDYGDEWAWYDTELSDLLNKAIRLANLQSSNYRQC